MTIELKKGTIFKLDYTFVLIEIVNHPETKKNYLHCMDTHANNIYSLGFEELVNAEFLNLKDCEPHIKSVYWQAVNECYDKRWEPYKKEVSEEPASKLDISFLTDLFTEVYSIPDLPLEEQSLYNLISRYQDKVSPRLLQMKKDLVSKAKKMGMTVLQNAINRPNPFLELIPKGSSSSGLYHQPVILGEDHGVTFRSDVKKV